MASSAPAPDVRCPVVSLEPRTTTNCLDMAAMFYGHHIAAILRGWAVVALPASAVVLWLAWRHGFDIRLALVAVYVATSVQSIPLVLFSIPALFGARLRLTDGLAKVGGRLPGLIAQVVLVRAVVAVGPALMLFSEDWLIGTGGFLLTVFPCGWIGVRAGFFPEKAALAALDRRLHDRETDRVLRQQSGELYSRACWIVIYYVILWAVVFVTVDFGWYLLAGDSPLIGRVLEFVSSASQTPAESRELLADLWYVLAHDRFLQVELTVAGLLVYPVARLGWLFCYVDARVRRDCWDMQLQFAEEVDRLRAQDVRVP